MTTNIFHHNQKSIMLCTSVFDNRIQNYLYKNINIPLGHPHMSYAIYFVLEYWIYVSITRCKYTRLNGH